MCFCLNHKCQMYFSILFSVLYKNGSTTALPPKKRRKKPCDSLSKELHCGFCMLVNTWSMHWKSSAEGLTISTPLFNFSLGVVAHRPQSGAASILEEELPTTLSANMWSRLSSAIMSTEASMNSTSSKSTMLNTFNSACLAVSTHFPGWLHSLTEMSGNSHSSSPPLWANVAVVATMMGVRLPRWRMLWISTRAAVGSETLPMKTTMARLVRAPERTCAASGHRWMAGSGIWAGPCQCKAFKVQSVYRFRRMCKLLLRWTTWTPEKPDVSKICSAHSPSLQYAQVVGSVATLASTELIRASTKIV
mmetsp:Transcript_92547/g.235303  ORF Transcript_92547/g.235303 Transcript_92547/m.235303 type:complete len:305 (-) Transcript_92547:18-932(-)